MYVGQKALAERTGKTDRTIRTQIARLKEDGLLTVLPAYRTTGSKGGRAVDVYLLHLPQFESVLAWLSGEEERLPEVFDKGLPEVFGTSETGSESQTGRLPEVFGEKPATISSCTYPVEDSRTQEKASTLNAVAASKVVAAGSKVPSVTIDKLKLNADEWQAAIAIIRAFNEGAGTKFRLMGSRGDRPTEHLKRIVGRLREHPEVTLEQHIDLIKRNCENPWWKGTATSVGVIYSPKVFPRCLATDGRPTHGRTFANERRTSPEDAPW